MLKAIKQLFPLKVNSPLKIYPHKLGLATVAWLPTFDQCSYCDLPLSGFPDTVI